MRSPRSSSGAATRRAVAQWIRCCALACLVGAAACDVKIASREPCQADRDCPAGQRCREQTCEVYPRLVGSRCVDGPDCQSAFCFESTCRNPCVAGACRADEYCTSGACLPKKAVGEDCADSAMCEAGATCESGRCRRRCPGADDSVCAAGQYCELGFCTNARMSGASCFRARMCASSVCVESTCRSACPLGTDAECDTGEYCELGVCAPRFAAGRGCLRNAQCTSDLCQGGLCRSVACSGSNDARCPVAEFCDVDTCRARVPAGESCARDRVCAQGSCVEARCRAACDFDARCARDEYCDGRECRPMLRAGAACTRSAQCEAGLCAQGACRAACVGRDDSPCAPTERCAEFWCLPRAATGAICDRPRECASERCVGGVCRAACVGADDASCGAGSTCDGAACVPRSQIGASCSRDSQCATNICLAGSCRGTCTGSADVLCARTETCNSDRCEPLRATSSACQRDGQCVTGHCSAGRCRALCVGTADADCAADEACDGERCQPRAPAGDSCTRDRECTDGRCVALQCRGGCAADSGCGPDEYCAALACQPRQATGATCDRAAACESGQCYFGVCRTSCLGQGDAPCAEAEYCDGQRCVERGSGATSCARDRVCQSGFCVDGVCCNARCNTCSRCDIVRGRCEPAVRDTLDARCPLSAPFTCGFSGRCDGTGNCSLYASGTSCSTRTCLGESVSAGGLCNGAGTCAVQDSIPCAPYTCDQGLCRTRCASNTECALGFTCDGSACRPFKLTLIAGGGAGDSGLATAANLKSPVKLALSTQGSERYLYIADEGAHRVRRVDLVTGLIQTVAGNGLKGFAEDGAVANASRITAPAGVAVFAGLLHFSDTGNRRVRKLDATGRWTTVLGTGAAAFGGDGRPGPEASVVAPRGLAFAPDGSLVVADYDNARLRRLDPTGVVSTLAGNGSAGYSGNNAPALSSQLDAPDGVAFNAASGDLYFADSGNERIRSVTSVSGNNVVANVVGTGISGFTSDGTHPLSTRTNEAVGVAFTGSLLLYADKRNHRVRAASSSSVTTIAGSSNPGFAGDGQLATSARLRFPTDVALDEALNRYIADTGNRRVRRVDVATGIITTIAGNGHESFSGDGLTGPLAALGTVGAMAWAANGELYFTQREPPLVRKLSAAGVVSTVAGRADASPTCAFGGPVASTPLGEPSGIVVVGTDVYFADTRCHVVRRIANGTVTTVAGELGSPGLDDDGELATDTKLDGPTALAADAAGRLLIADTNNHKVRVITNGRLFTVAGSGRSSFDGDGAAAPQAGVPFPRALAVSGVGDVFIADASRRVRRVNAATSVISTLAGNGAAPGAIDDVDARAAPLGLVGGIAVDTGGNVLLALEEGRKVVAWLVASARLRTVAGTGADDEPGSGADARQSPMLGPRSLGFSPIDGRLYVLDGLPLDARENRIRRLD